MLLVRGFALLILIALVVLAVDTLVPDRNVEARSALRAALVTDVSTRIASLGAVDCGTQLEVDCETLAALPVQSP